MSSAAKKILEDALALPEEERKHVVEVLLTSLHRDPPEEVDAAWSEEAMRRLQRCERGETVAEDWDEVKRRLREKYHFG